MSSPKFYMLACDSMGSIAEMPLMAEQYDEADVIAKQWLDTYDHGFIKAIVVSSIYRDQMVETCESTREIWDRIVNTLIPSAVIFDETEEYNYDQGLIDYTLRKRDE